MKSRKTATIFARSTMNVSSSGKKGRGHARIESQITKATPKTKAELDTLTKHRAPSSVVLKKASGRDRPVRQEVRVARRTKAKVALPSITTTPSSDVLTRDQKYFDTQGSRVAPVLKGAVNLVVPIQPTPPTLKGAAICSPTTPGMPPVLSEASRDQSPTFSVPPDVLNAQDHMESATHAHPVEREAEAMCLESSSMKLPSSDVIPAIRELHRQRQDFHGAEKKLSLQIKAIQRRTHAVGCEKKTHATCPGVYDSISPVVAAIAGSRKTLEIERKVREKEMERLAKTLPVWPWWEAIRGVGALGLAQIVGEAGGPLTLYGNPAKLWKRFGVGLVGNERQRLVKDPELAIAMGYNPSRRSVLHVLGEALMKGNRGEWKKLYDDRKEYERTKPACLKLMVGGVCKDPELPCCKAAHVHNRALRYMEKRLLRDLWREWRRVAPAVTSASPNTLVSAQNLSEVAI